MALTACSDYLNPEITEAIRPEKFYNTENQIEQAMVGLYRSIYNFPKYRFIMSECRSDNVWCETADKTTGQYQIVYFLNSLLADNSLLLEAWQDYYISIATANAILDRIDDVSFSNEEYKNEYKAEARFIRALAYFELVRFFGNVPMTDRSLTPQESLTVPQSTAKEVYEKMIVPDLEYAAENLLDTPTRYDGDTDAATGRATKVAAKALLGEVYLTMSGFPINDTSKKELAKNLFLEVVNYANETGKFKVANIDDWRKMWVHENDNKYFIFEVQFAMDLNYGVGNTVTRWSVAGWGGSTSYYGGFGKQTDADDGCMPFVNPALRAHFLEKDANGDYVDKRGPEVITIYSKNLDKDGNPKALDPTSSNTCFYTKFWEHKAKREALGLTGDMWGGNSAYASTGYWPQNFPLIRLENIKLYLAEILGPTEGLPYLKEIRTVAGLDTDNNMDEETFREAVENERRYELAEEGYRWFDLVRQNKWQTALKQMFIEYGETSTNEALMGYAGNVQSFTYIYPIPTTQLNAVVGLYKQNPGY